MNSLSTQQAENPDSFGIARRTAAWVSLAALMAGVSGCAVLDGRAPGEVVKEKAQARWDALVKGDVPAAYGYFSPTSKSVMTLDAYRSSMKPGFWKAVTVDKVDCQTSESCDVVVTIEYEFQARRMKTQLKETWIREGRNWWYVQK